MKRIALALLLAAQAATASVNVVVNGTTYRIPETNERGWGASVTSWMQGISGATLQKSGGTFTLTADASFGATYGLLSQYFTTRSSNAASAGNFRLANLDTISWRNAANSANLALSVNASNQLTFNGNAFLGSSVLTASKALETSAAGVIQASSFGPPTNANTASAVVARDASGNFTAGTITASLSGNVTGNLTGAVTGNASTATALAANPADCSANQFATTIAASGDLTCAQPTVSNLSALGASKALETNGSGVITVSSFAPATSANTASALVARDGSGNFSAGTITATLSGNASNVSGTVAIANGGTGQVTAQAAIDALLPSQGSNSGKFLTTNGTTSSWGTPAGTALSVVTKTTTYTATTSDDVIFGDTSGGAWTLALYTAVGNTGKRLYLKKTTSDTTAWTIDPNASETINGVTTWKLATQYSSLTLISDGTNWQILSFEIGDSYSYTFTGNGHGTNNKIRLMSGTPVSAGGDVACTNPATGSQCVINTPGIYDITYIDKANLTALFGITKNPSVLTGAGGSVASLAMHTEVLATAETDGTIRATAHAAERLAAGDTVYPQTDGNVNSTSAQAVFFIVRKIGL
jgi:hypothetical protein